MRLALLCFLLATLPASADIVPVEAIGKAQSINLSASTWLLEDPDGNLTLDDIRSPAYANRFQTGSSALGYTTSAYWLRWTVRNGTTHDSAWWLDTADRYSKEIDFFILGADGAYQHQTASSRKPYADRPIPAPNFVFPLILRAEQTVDVYLRVRSSGYLQVSVHPVLWQPEAFVSKQQRDRLSWFFYLGMAAGLGLFNLLLYFSIRDRAYLLYVIAVAFTVVVTDCFVPGAGAKGIMYGDLWPDSPVFSLTTPFGSAFFAVSATMYFTATYIDLRTIMPKAYRAGQWIFLFFGTAVLIGFFRLSPEPPISASVAKIAQIVAMSSGAFILAGFLWIVTKLAITGNLRGRLVLVAYTPALALDSVATVARVFYIYVEWPVPPIMLGSGFEMIMMSLALGARFNQERKEKARAQAELVEGLQRSERELEAKVIQRTGELEREQMRTKELLYNILPVELADELAATGTARPARHELVSILFSDFSGFTQAASTMPADRIVAELNEIFAGFDDICDELGVEKIKTIGDAYMAAAGLPKSCADHAQRCVTTGLRMIDLVEQRNRQAAFKWGLRVGIHSGSVVAGVVGKRKYAFDIWGDTVNIASRMESSGEVGRVNISAYTYDLVRNDFDCEYRGKVGAKGKGDIDMYFVKTALRERQL